jgi:hypothetical protein
MGGAATDDKAYENKKNRHGMTVKSRFFKRRRLSMFTLTFHSYSYIL